MLLADALRTMMAQCNPTKQRNTFRTDAYACDRSAWPDPGQGAAHRDTRLPSAKHAEFLTMRLVSLQLSDSGATRRLREHVQCRDGCTADTGTHEWHRGWTFSPLELQMQKQEAAQ